MIQPNAAKLAGQGLILQIDNDLKHTATQEFLKAKKLIFFKSSVPGFRQSKDVCKVLKAILMFAVMLVLFSYLLYESSKMGVCV